MKRVTTIYIPDDVFNKVKLRKMNLSGFVTNVLRNYFRQDLNSEQLDESLREARIRIEVLEAKKRELDKARQKLQGVQDYINQIRPHRNRNLSEHIFVTDYKGAKELGYIGTYDEFMEELFNDGKRETT